MAGLRFLPAAVPTLLLALLAEFFRFLLFVVVCRAGSALARPAKRNRGHAKNIMHTDGDTWRCVCVGLLLCLWSYVVDKLYRKECMQNQKHAANSSQNAVTHACRENTEVSHR